MKKVLNVFFVVMAVVFVYLLFNVVFNNNTSYAQVNPFILILLSTLYILIMYFLYILIRKKVKSSKGFFVISFIVFIIIQLLFGFCFAVRPSWDFGAVNDSVFWDLDGDVLLNNNKYFYRYSNNIGMFLFLKLFYSFIYLFNKSHFVMLSAGLLLNIILIDISILFMYKMMKLFFDDKSVTFFMILTFIFTPFITYVPIFYTDTYSLPFGIMAIYFYILNLNCSNRNLLYIVIAGLLLGIGCCLKFSLFIIFIAIVLYDLVSKRIFSKRGLFNISFLLLFMVIPIFLLNLYVNINFDKDRLDKENFPIYHYFMMGLTNNGGYNQEDVYYTESFIGKDNKKNADIKILKKRLNQLVRDGGLLEFYTNKSVYTWGDGTYFAPRKLAINPLHNFRVRYFVIDGNNCNIFYKVIAQIQGVLVIVFIILGIMFRKYLSEKEKNLQLFLNIIIFGVFCFFLIWEARSRYIINFLPVILLSSYLGIISIKNFLCERYNFLI